MDEIMVQHNANSEDEDMQEENIGDEGDISEQETADSSDERYRIETEGRIATDQIEFNYYQTDRQSFVEEGRILLEFMANMLPPVGRTQNPDRELAIESLPYQDKSRYEAAMGDIAEACGWWAKQVTFRHAEPEEDDE